MARLPGNIGRRPGLTKIWALRSASAVERIARLIASDIESERTPATVDPQDDAGRLFVLVQGRSFQSLVDPARWPPQRLRNVVDVELARLRHPAVGGVLRGAGSRRRTS